MSILGNYGGFLTGGGGGVGSSAGTSQSTGSSQQRTDVVPGMLPIYNQLLGLNRQNYGNVMNAYQQGQQRAAAQLPGVYGGYGQLSSDVMNTLGMGQVLGQNGNWGVAGPAATAIADTFKETQGRNIDQLVSAGLGNTTENAALQQQAAQQATKSYADLGAQLATQAAQQQAQIGQAGLGAQMQGLGLQTDLTKGALGPLGQPFANTAGSLTGGFGSSQQQSTSQQQAQNRQQQPGYQQGGLQTGSGGAEGLPAGVPGGPSGGGGGGGGGGEIGGLGDMGLGGVGGFGSAPGYNPAGAYGPPPAGPGGPQTISPTQAAGAASATGQALGALQGLGLGSGLGGALGAATGIAASGALGEYGPTMAEMQGQTPAQQAATAAGLTDAQAAQLQKDLQADPSLNPTTAAQNIKRGQAPHYGGGGVGLGWW
jgi:hypothetical protein